MVKLDKRGKNLSYGPTLTGIWKSNDGGTYYMLYMKCTDPGQGYRGPCSADELWWIGMSGGLALAECLTAKLTLKGVQQPQPPPAQPPGGPPLRPPPEFGKKSEQEDVRHVSERYIANQILIVMVPTPYAPDGLFENIEKEPEETCIYKRIFMDYTYGLDKIYTNDEINKAKISPSFEREYNLKYLGLIGNVFQTKDIDAAIERGTQYNPEDPNIFARKSIGIDPGWGSSPFGICITQFVNGNEIQILYADEFERPDYNVMLSKVRELVQKYDPNIDRWCKS